MTASASSSSSGTQAAEPFEERVDMLFEELELAVRWQRPSILVAVYASEFVRDEAQAILTRRLSGLGQQVAAFRVEAGNFDVPLALAQNPQREQAVFFVSGLRWGGGKGGFEAYRALNLHREYFVEEKIRAVFWLTLDEAGVLPHHAPDFWAFRHRVIEFLDAPAQKSGTAAVQDLAWGEWQPDELRADVDDKIDLRAGLLESLPQGDESLAARLDLLHLLAALYWAKGNYASAKALLDQGLALADRLGDPALRARFWTGLGIVAHSLGRADEAVSACRKASELSPGDAVPWSNLAMLYRSLDQSDQALQACNRALELDPRAAGSWNTLGDVHRDQGRLEEARQAYLTATRLAPGVARAWENLGRTYRALNRPREALRAYSKATRLGPGEAAPWKELGEVYRGLGRMREAIKAYQKALALDPADASARASLSACEQAAAGKR
jgi:tetratricopeptide (TPR) repeat protein